MDGHFTVAHTASSYAMLKTEAAGVNLMDAILKTFSGLMSVVSKWRATGDFAAGKSETLQSLNQGACTGPTFLKVRTVMQRQRLSPD